MNEWFNALLPAIALISSTLAALFNKYVLNSKNGLVKWLVSFLIIQTPVIVHAFTAYHFQNKTLIAAQAGIATIITTPWYLAFIEPFILRIEASTAKKEADKAKIAAYDEMVKSAAEPVNPTV